MTGTPVAVIGGGPMGLACAYELLKQGRAVTIYDAGPRLGGMSVAFDFGGLNIDRHFHFICKTDHEYFRVLDELKLSSTLKWRRTRMGMYHERELLEWGDPVSLLKFPGLSWATKIRYGFNVLSVKRRDSFDDLDKLNARAWLRDRIGERGYNVLWEPLLAGKFHHHQGNVSAAWVAARVQRLGRSRDLFMRERLGYLEGGSDTLIQGLEARIRELGGQVRLDAPVERILTDHGRVTGVRVSGEEISHGRVVSTIALPLLGRMVDFREEHAAALGSIDYLGVVTVIMKLKQSLTPYFWTNISDPSIDIPGIIEFSNLNPLGCHLVYVPFYMPRTHPRFTADHEELMQQITGLFGRINPEFRDDWVLESHSSRIAAAQAVCTPGFAAKVAPLDGWIEGLHHADTTSYYPQDRSISSSLLTGRRLAERALVAT